MDLIEPLLETIEEIAELSKAAQVNTEQVFILLIACNHLRSYIEIWSSTSCSWILHKHQQILSLLHHSLVRILNLVTIYSNESIPWIHLVHENETEFQALLEDLSIHVDLLMSALALSSDKAWASLLRKSAWETFQTLKLGLKSSTAAGRDHRHSITNSALASMNTINPLELDLEHQSYLGQGSFAKVFRTTWLGHEVAVKTFPKELTADDEGELMVKLRPCHPSVLQVFGWFEFEDQSSLVMELMQQSLARIIHMLTTSPILVTIEILLQIAQGMRFVHSKGVIHRDLKPGNVLVSYEGDLRGELLPHLVVKVADFGLSKMNFSSLNQHSHLRGTLMYMAPEMITGDPYTRSSYKRSVDVYSFGILCVEVLTAQRPFAPTERKTFLNHVLAGLRPKLPDRTPAQLRKMIELCWDTEPARRPTFDAVCSMLWGLKGLLLTGKLYSVPGSGISVQGQLLLGERLTGHGKFVSEAHWSICYWVRHLPNGEKVGSTVICEVKSEEKRPEYLLNASARSSWFASRWIDPSWVPRRLAGYGGVVECSEQYRRGDCRSFKVKVRRNKDKEWGATLRTLELRGRRKASKKYDQVGRIEIPVEEANECLCVIKDREDEELWKIRFRCALLSHSHHAEQH